MYFSIRHLLLSYELYRILCKIHQQSYRCPDVAETNQEKIVEAGGLTSLLRLLGSSQDETIKRVAAGAIANLAMNGKVVNPLHSHEYFYKNLNIIT